MSEGGDRTAANGGGPTKSGGEGMWLAILAAAAYFGFGAVMIFHGGGRPGAAAHAGVPLDAVLAVTRGAPNDSAAPPVGAGEPPGGYTADTIIFEEEPRGSGAAVTAQAAGGVVGVGGPDGPVRLQFLVKLRDGETWRDRFLDDPAAARQAWADFARDEPAFAGLRLVRMSYSGEATLELEGDAPSSPAVQREMAADIAERLRAAPGVEYAEPNLVGVRENAQ
jgi:hypothetical protein